MDGDDGAFPMMDEISDNNTTDSNTCWECKWCDAELSSKQALLRHQAKAVCIKTGYVCLRCLNMWQTQSEYHRHKTSNRKCKKRESCTLERLANGAVIAVTEKNEHHIMQIKKKNANETKE